jgi:hypothetical protein
VPEEDEEDDDWRIGDNASEEPGDFDELALLLFFRLAEFGPSLLGPGP